MGPDSFAAACQDGRAQRMRVAHHASNSALRVTEYCGLMAVCVAPLQPMLVAGAVSRTDSMVIAELYSNANTTSALVHVDTQSRNYHAAQCAHLSGTGRCLAGLPHRQATAYIPARLSLLDLRLSSATLLHIHTTSLVPALHFTV
jgi:hypothetical protein